MGLLLPLILRCCKCRREVRARMHMYNGAFAHEEPVFEPEPAASLVGWLLPSRQTSADDIACGDCRPKEGAR